MTVSNAVIAEAVRSQDASLGTVLSILLRNGPDQPELTTQIAVLAVHDPVTGDQIADLLDHLSETANRVAGTRHAQNDTAARLVQDFADTPIARLNRARSRDETLRSAALWASGAACIAIAAFGTAHALATAMLP